MIGRVSLESSTGGLQSQASRGHHNTLSSGVASWPAAFNKNALTAGACRRALRGWRRRVALARFGLRVSTREGVAPALRPAAAACGILARTGRDCGPLHDIRARRTCAAWSRGRAYSSTSVVAARVGNCRYSGEGGAAGGAAPCVALCDRLAIWVPVTPLLAIVTWGGWCGPRAPSPLAPKPTLSFSAAPPAVHGPMADSPGSNVDPTLMVHPLTGERREFTGVVLEAALSESAKQVKVPCKGRLADALWQVVRASATHAQAGKPSLTAAALALALPTINEATSAYVSGLPRSAGAKATRKRPRRAADAGGGEAPLPEGTVAERAAGAPKRPRDGAEVQPPVAPAARHAAPVRKPSAPSSTAARPADDPLRRLQARRVAELLNRRDWDAGAADKFAGLLRQPAEDQLLVAQSVLHLVTRGKNLALSGCLAHVPEFVAWISSALEARLYGVIDVLCKMLLRFDAASIHAVCCARVSSHGAPSVSSIVFSLWPCFSCPWPLGARACFSRRRLIGRGV